MFNRQLDQQTELRELGRDDVEQFFNLVYENREHLGKWMFWVSESFIESKYVA
jgi:hypothetical protein